MDPNPIKPVHYYDHQTFNADQRTKKRERDEAKHPTQERLHQHPQHRHQLVMLMRRASECLEVNTRGPQLKLELKYDLYLKVEDKFKLCTVSVAK